MRIAVEASAVAVAPAGWSPGAVSPSTSTRTPGLLRGGLDAWRGVPERSAGVGLTTVQVDLLAPFLAREHHVDAQIAVDDLRRVRVHLGGLAANAGWTATTVGLNIYVSGAEQATHILSWEGRRWLAHELGHTMQWRRIGARQASDAARDRAFLNTYVGAFAAHDGHVSQGGFASALREWQRRRDAGEPAKKLPDLLHDTHPLEREAERVAQAFAAAHR
jgi:hypothetical protein